QPMHAFDLRHFSKDGIGIRMANKRETMATLDGVGRELLDTDLLITSGGDPQKGGGEPVALAGIMGGEGSMVADDTTQLFLESANFQSTTIRRTSSRLGLRTDSSTRFEKSLDPANAEAAVHRYTSLLMELCAGATPAGPMVDPAHSQYQPQTIRLRKARLAMKLGIEVPDTQVEQILTSLQFGVDRVADGDAGWQAAVPSFRATKDITIEDDLIEEVGRMYRYDNIPEIPLRTVVAIPPRETELFLSRTMVDSCALELGCNEVYNYSFVPDQVLEAVNADKQRYTMVKNPVAPEIGKMRRHVLPSLLAVVAQNLREQDGVRLLEHGMGYQPERKDEHGLPHESREICLVYARRDGQPCYPLLRSYLASLLERVGFPPSLDELRRSDDLPWIHPGRTVALQREGIIYGYVGLLHPDVCHNLGLPDSTAVATVDVRQMLKTGREEKRYQPIPRFPPQPVDVAFLVPAAARVADLQQFLVDANPKLVRKVELFEVYRGDGLPEDKKSLNFTVTLGAEDRTLTATDEEKYLAKVRQKCGDVGAELRG
ncbi:MAG: phenylalanine--tRNA ligase subunit beta, partial [Planctomycetota bacterium]